MNSKVEVNPEKVHFASCKAAAFKDATRSQIQKEAIRHTVHRRQPCGLFGKVKAMLGIRCDFAISYSFEIFLFSDQSFLTVRESGESTVFLCNNLVDDWGQVRD
jgi:hypothetical protein